MDAREAMQRLEELKKTLLGKIDDLRITVLDKIEELGSIILGESELERQGFEYGINMHGIDYNETIRSGIVEPLMQARNEGRRFCVEFGYVIPSSKDWDIFGDGEWNPSRRYITTDDIATPDNDREQEEKNIYDFLRGKKMEETVTKTK